MFDVKHVPNRRTRGLFTNVQDPLCVFISMTGMGLSMRHLIFPKVNLTSVLEGTFLYYNFEISIIMTFVIYRILASLLLV